MIEPSPVPRRPIGRIVGIAVAVITVGAITAGGAVILARRSGVEIAFPVAARAASGSPTVATGRGTELRSGPAPDTAIVTHVPAGARVRLLGRSPDGTWLAVALDGAADVAGSIPADAAQSTKDAVGRLTVVANIADVAPNPSGAPTALPDLRIESATSRDNRLVAIIVNDGPGDLPTPLLVAVNDGPPIRIETTGGPLRARARIEAPIPGEYVQLRARVALRVQTEPAPREASVNNNTWTGIVEPDQPNNISIVNAFADGPDNHLVVTVRNDSPIPIRGMIMLTVREPLPSTTLLGRDSREVGLDPSKTIDVAFPDIRQVDLQRIAIRLSTVAIQDAVLADDSYPR